LTWEEAASVPLCTLTAWEGLLEGLAIPRGNNSKKTLLIVAGAGGVGSLGIQIAKKILGLTVIATASRGESIEAAKRWGADHVINHRKDLGEQLKALGYEGVDYILNCIDPKDNFDTLTPILNPFGGICCIVYAENLKLGDLFRKRATFVWEYMFSRSTYGVELEKQKAILDEMADLIDNKVIVHTLTKTFPDMSGLAEAHKIQESGNAIGKIALTANF